MTKDPRLPVTNLVLSGQHITMSDMKIAVFGWGAFGQAIGSLLEYNGVKFTIVEVGRPLEYDVDLIFMAVPTQFIRDALETNAAFIRPDTIIVNTAKGIEEHTNKLPYQIVQSVGHFPKYYSLIGPSFASEIKDRQPTLLSLGYATREHVPLIKELLQTPYLRVQEIKGRRALELASALKNIYAIVCGYADGLGYGMNTRAKLITLALQEFVELGQAMQLAGGTVTAPGVVGDLVLTCSSRESRNFQYGRRLSKMSHDAALRKSKGVVEGVGTSHSVQALCQKYEVSLPLAKLTASIIVDGKNGRQHFQNFVSSL